MQDNTYVTINLDAIVKNIDAVSAKAGVPVIAIVGNVADNAYDAYNIGVSAIFSINRLAIPRSEAKRRSSTDYTHTLDDVLRCWKAAQMSRH